MAKRHCIRYGRREGGGKTCREFAPGAWRPGLGDLGAVAGKKWYRAPRRAAGVSPIWRPIAASIRIARVGDTGEGGRPKPYRAIACIGKSPRAWGGVVGHTRLPAHRCGEARGRTPTAALKGAFRDLGRSFK